MNAKLEAVIAQELEFHGVELLDALSRWNTSALRRCRRSIALRCRDELGMSYPEIGRILGGRHHTTIMSMLKRLGWQRNE